MPVAELTDDEVFGQPAELTDADVFGHEQELSDEEVFAPVDSGALDRFLSAEIPQAPSLTTGVSPSLFAPQPAKPSLEFDDLKMRYEAMREMVQEPQQRQALFDAYKQEAEKLGVSVIDLDKTAEFERVTGEQVARAFPELPESVAKGVAGFQRGAAGLSEGLVSPEGVMAMGGGMMPSAGMRTAAGAIGKGFVGQMAASYPEQVAQFSRALGAKDIEGATEAGVGLVATPVMVAGGLREGRKPNAEQRVTVPEERPTGDQRPVAPAPEQKPLATLADVVGDKLAELEARLKAVEPKQPIEKPVEVSRIEPGKPEPLEQQFSAEVEKSIQAEKPVEASAEINRFETAKLPVEQPKPFEDLIPKEAEASVELKKAEPATDIKFDKITSIPNFSKVYESDIPNTRLIVKKTGRTIQVEYQDAKPVSGFVRTGIATASIEPDGRVVRGGSLDKNAPLAIAANKKLSELMDDASALDVEAEIVTPPAAEAPPVEAFKPDRFNPETAEAVKPDQIKPMAPARHISSLMGMDFYHLEKSVGGLNEGTHSRREIEAAGFRVPEPPSKPSPYSMGVVDPGTRILQDFLRNFLSKPEEKAFTKGALSRAAATMVRGTSLPKEMVEARIRNLDLQKYIEETIKLQSGDLRAEIKAEFKTPKDIEAANKRLLDYLNGKADVSTVGGPAVQRKAAAIRNEIDGLSELAVNQGIVHGSMADVWLGNKGEWLKRTYLAFDRTADWNYDTLLRRKNKGDVEITRIWNNVEAYLKKQDPKRTPGQIEAEMRSLIDRRAVEDALGITETPAPGSGKRVAVEISSLLRRKDLAPEVREWMGEIKDPYTKVLQSGKWMAQFISRNVAQREMAAIGEKMGILSNEKTGRYTQELFPNETQFVPEKDATGQPRKTPEGEPIGSYRTRVDRRHEPLSGYYTTPEFKAALEEFDARMNNTIAGLNFGTAAGKVLLGATAWQKGALVGMNPYSYGVNTIGGLVNRMATGAINPIHYKRAWNAVLRGKAPVIDAKATQKALQARADFLLATKAGMTGKGILTGDIEANLQRQVESGATRRAVKAIGDILADPKAGGGYGRLRRALEDMWRTPGEIGIRFMDDVFRVSAFFDELALAKKAYPGWTEKQQVEWAADRAANLYQNYDRLPKILRDASRVGALNTFVSFKFEVMRNAFWTAKYAQEGLKSSNPEIRKDAAQKAVGLMVMAAAPFALAALGREKTGVSEEEDKALKRQIVAPWDRSEQLFYIKKGDGTYAYVPVGYLLPTFELTRPFTSIWDAAQDPNPEEAYKRMASGWATDYFGPGAVLGPLMEAGMNKRIGQNRPLTLREGVEGATDRLGYVAENFTPRALRVAQEVSRAAAGETGDYGRTYSAQEIAAKLGGLRQRTIDINKAAPFVLRGLAARWRDASTYQNIEERKAGSPESKRATEAAEYEKEKKEDLKKLYQQAVKDLQLLGVSVSEIEEIEKKNGVPKELRE